MLFAVWSVVGFALELPSGALADATSRRALLVVAQLLTAAAFAVWVLVPSFAAFAAGFVLWGTAGALQSGALEALTYDELDHLGAADRYAGVIGRMTACGTVSATAAIGLAAPVLAAGGFAAVGAASVAACLAAAVVAAGLPERRGPTDGDGSAAPGPGVGAVLRAGVAEVRARPAVRAAVLLVAAVTAVWGSLDEYVPLLADATGVDAANVPLLFGLVYLGVTLGGVLGGRVARLSRRGLAGVLVAGALALAAGALAGSPAGFAGVAAGFCAFQAATVAADARLQAAIEGPSRATVTSLAGLATEALVLAVFAAYGLGSAVATDAQLFAALAATYLVVAAVLARPGSHPHPGR